MVGKTLVDAQRDYIPLRMVNLTNEPRQIPSGKEVATCEPVESIVYPSSDSHHEPVSPDEEEAFKAVQEMHAQGIIKIEPSAGPWASPVVLVKKKDGSTRFCVDYQKLNELTKKDSYPLPRVDTTLDALSGLSWFSILVLKSGYWQVEEEEQDREKTAFTAGNGLCKFNVMAFGLCNTPVTFEQLMNNILGDLRCLVYLNDDCTCKNL